jgi:simple sugar transport system substrate-binding protein
MTAVDCTRPRCLSRRGLMVGAGAAATTAALGVRPPLAAAQGDQPWVEWVSSFMSNPVKIGVSCFATANPYFNPSSVATTDAGAQLGIETTWSGPPTPDTTTQISQVNDLIRQGYQAVIIIPGEADPWVQPIKDATDKGVLVFCANQDSPNSARELFFGQDLYAGGQTQAELIHQFTGAKTGQVVMTNCAPGSDALNKRSAGCRDGLTALGYEVVDEVTTDPTDAAKLRGTLEDVLRAHPDIVALAPLCGPDTAEAGKLRQRNGGTYVIVGHDLLFDTLTGIEAGNIDATLGQNPYAQAYLPIMYAYQRVVIGTPEIDLPDGNWFTGTEIVNKDNVAQFITREKRFQSS